MKREWGYFIGSCNKTAGKTMQQLRSKIISVQDLNYQHLYHFWLFNIFLLLVSLSNHLLPNEYEWMITQLSHITSCKFTPKRSWILLFLFDSKLISTGFTNNGVSTQGWKKESLGSWHTCSSPSVGKNV